MGTNETRWLDEGQQRVWRAFIMGTELLRQELDHDLSSEHGMSLSEYEVLVRLSEQDGWRMRMSVLAAAMCHSRSRITHTVSRMEEDGLVRRQPATADGRGVEAVMTEAGQAKLEECAPTHVSGVRSHFIDLATREDLAAVLRVMDEVCDRLGEMRMPEGTDIR